MTAALTGPFAVAALVLCIAGVAKVRAPHGAAGALATLRLPSSPALVRVVALAEVTLGVWALIRPSALSAALVAIVYAVFCGLSLLLARRHAECGCFGAASGGTPASAVQAVLSGVLAAVALAAAVAGVHGIGWILGSAGATIGLVAALGILGAAYAAVLVYTALPQAWAAWSGR
jgi:hypothetical protein